MKTGKITAIIPDGNWNNGKQTFNRFKVTLATGEQWNFSAVGEFKKQIGEEIEFEVLNEQYKNAKLVLTQPKSFGGGFTKSPEQQTSIIRQSMLKASVDYWSGQGADEGTIIETARQFVNFVNNG